MDLSGRLFADQWTKIELLDSLPMGRSHLMQLCCSPVSPELNCSISLFSEDI
jgi:hypothetical protein